MLGGEFCIIFKASYNYIWTMGQLTMCKGATHSDEHTELSNDPAVPLSSMRCFSIFQRIVLILWPHNLDPSNVIECICVELELTDKKNLPTNRMSTKKAPSSNGLACGRVCSLIHTLWRISSTSSFTSMLTLRCRSREEIQRKRGNRPW